MSSNKVHVINSSEAVKAENETTEMPFHTDLVCDVMTTLTRTCAATGRAPVLAPSWTVYNELAATRPDLIHVLAQHDCPFDTFGRDPAFYRRALLHFEDGKIITNFSRRCLVGHAPTGGARTPGIPGLTEAQADTLNALHAIGRRHELKTTMVPGDIRIINNMAVMHRRNVFEDGQPDEQDEGGGLIPLSRRRHLLRLWLHNPAECWTLPSELALAWERIYGDGEREEHWDLLTLDKENGGVYIRPIWDGDKGSQGGKGKEGGQWDDGDEDGGKGTACNPTSRHPPATMCD